MPSTSIDIEFSAPLTHRLRTTDDVAGRDFDVLKDVLTLDNLDVPGTKIRVLMVGESAIKSQVNAIQKRLETCSEIELVGQAQMVDGGESIKSDEHVLRGLLDQIHDHSLDRRSYILAIGGGAMLDTVGFAASIAHRGIRLVRIPSTVLAQADSGVGVKNAINYFRKKNWVGTFAVPWAVINDASILTTLPDREFVSGFSEAVKVSLLKDPQIFEWLCTSAVAIRKRQPDVVGQAIDASCRMHLHHITSGGDPFEIREARPLDFGHWSAHRLEPLTQYQLLHGEAVGMGVAIDCLYSAIQFGFPESDAHRVCDCLAAMGMPLWDEAIDPVDRLLEGLEEFRQHLGGRLTITMLRSIGDPINVHQIDTDAMKQAIEQLRQRCLTTAGDSNGG